MPSLGRRISPPAWGWPEVDGKLLLIVCDFPTRVGMARSCSACLTQSSGFPHPRGDGPVFSIRAFSPSMISPPAWGWPGAAPATVEQTMDFPTRVGMARAHPFQKGRAARFPHPRGDGPRNGEIHVHTNRISPPAWGWPAFDGIEEEVGDDFPTRVGMARNSTSANSGYWRFPHPRGDGPPTPWSARCSRLISPPAWGWPGRSRRPAGPLPDFPTRVGMARSFGINGPPRV